MGSTGPQNSAAPSKHTELERDRLVRLWTALGFMTACHSVSFAKETNSNVQLESRGFLPLVLHVVAINETRGGINFPIK